MACFSLYKCPSCGYEVATEPTGHFITMRCFGANVRCHKCNEIGSVSLSNFMEEGLFCEHCGNEDVDTLTFWNPIEGKCPKCNTQLEQKLESYCLVD